MRISYEFYLSNEYEYYFSNVITLCVKHVSSMEEYVIAKTRKNWNLVYKSISSNLISVCAILLFEIFPTCVQSNVRIFFKFKISLKLNKIFFHDCLSMVLVIISPLHLAFNWKSTNILLRWLGCNLWNIALSFGPIRNYKGPFIILCSVYLV